MKRKRIRTGHKDQRKRYKSANGPLIPCPTQGDGYQDTAGYKYHGTFGSGDNKKDFYGNNVEMVKKLVENYYLQLLKKAVAQKQEI
jgi:hypothetical protein